MDSPSSDAEHPPPEQPEAPPAEPVVDLGDTPEPPPDTDAALAADEREPVVGADESDETEGTLEGADPEASDDEAAPADRQRGLWRAYNLGDRSRSYQAAKMYFYGAEFAAVPQHGPVPASLLKPLNSVYAEVRSHRELLAALQSSPLQCLVGEPRTGRTTSAIAVAAEYLRQRGLKVEGNIHILTSEHGLAAVDPKSIAADKALILDVAELQSTLFGSIEEHLRRQRSALIVVAAGEPVGPAALSFNRTVTYRPPSTEAVLRRHLGLRLPTGRVETLLSLANVRANLRPCRSANEAARLAAEILNQIDDGVAEADLLAEVEPSGFLKEAGDELRKRVHWERDFLIATTVLSELTASTVIREATRLAELHEPDLGSSEIPRARWFEGPLDGWSDCIKLDGRDDDGAGRTVRLVHPTLGRHLLRLIWREHLGERDRLLTWILGLGAHRERQVRDKAAQAAAQLATCDFDMVTREVLRLWALDGRYKTRRTASLALERLAIADDGRFASRVQSLVRGWAKSSSAQLLAASATAYGTFLGAQVPQEALDGMRGITGGRVNRSHWRRGSSRPARIERELAGIVRRALLDMFDAGAQEKVVLELEYWTRMPHWRWRKAAARSLPDLARRDGPAGLPLLAELADGQPEIYTATLALWHNAFAPDNRGEQVWEALRRWLDIADELRVDRGSAELAGVIDRLVADLRTDAETARNLDFHLHIWAFHKDRRLPDDPDTSLPWRPRHD